MKVFAYVVYLLQSVKVIFFMKIQVKQSEAIDMCDQRLNQIDDKGFFVADDEIGWFFTEVKKIQEAINEFRLR